MSKLTKKEAEWLDRLEDILLNPPSERIGFYTIGDSDLMCYDKSYDDQIDELSDKHKEWDFCVCVAHLEASLGIVKASTAIQSTAG